MLRDWLTTTSGEATDPLFPSRRGVLLSRDAVAARVTHYHAIASQTCSSLTEKTVSPHTFRHTNAMDLRHAGVDIAVLALWLGHADIKSTQPYLHADLENKERALALTSPPDVPPGRYRPPDPLLAFLENL